MINIIKNYINDNNFKFTYFDNNLHVINYKYLVSVEKNNVSLKSNNKKVIIKGKNLFLKRILDNELLINGNIEEIEVIDE